LASTAPNVSGITDAVRQGLRQLLLLGSADPKRVGAFFALYFLLFAMLTLADGLSLALFVQRVGAAALPRFYGLVAAANLVVIGAYVLVAERTSSLRMLCAITMGAALAFFILWVGIAVRGDGAGWYGSLFAVREVIYTLVLMHFGTFLQDYFTRVELARIMPLVYAGGRVGGIFGGLALSLASGSMPLGHLLFACAVASMLAAGWAVALSRRFPHARSPEDDEVDEGLAGNGELSAAALDRAARESARGFLRFVRHSPLMFWNTVGALLYVACRWVLNFQYNTYFEAHFDSDVEMARFLGIYAQVALFLSLLLQIFVVGRLVRWLGLKGAQLIYASLLALGFGLNATGLTFPQAVFSRFLETELRFGLRNPLNQLVINKFSKPLRIRVRAFSMGLLVPAATLVTSAGLTLITGAGLMAATGIAGAALGALYLGSILRLNASFREPRSPEGGVSSADG
jgi:hypothetical protein